MSEHDIGCVTATGALLVQDELLRYWRGPAGRSFADGYIKARQRTHHQTIEAVADGAPQFGPSGHVRDMDDGVLVSRAETEWRRLIGARTYWISDDMLQLAHHAAESMPTQILLESDLPCPNGFAMFERPVVIADLHGKNIAMSGFCWQRALGHDPASDVSKPVMSISFYTDPHDPRDEYMGKALREAIEAGSLRHNVPRALLLTELVAPFGEEPFNVEKITERLAEVYGKAPDADNTRRNVHWLWGVPLALWALMGQTIGQVTIAQAERTIRRRLEKAGSPMAANPIRMVTLRRERHEEHEPAPGSVEWSHRWIVGGHWRQQWLPSVKAHRLQWIMPFVKGPVDKPLVVKRTVHKLVR